MPRSILLRQLAAEVTRGKIDIDLPLRKPSWKLRIAGVNMMRRVACDDNHEVRLRRSGKLTDLRRRLRKSLRQPLEVIDKLRALLQVEERMIILALLAAQLAHIRDTQRHHRQRRIDLQSS